MLFKLLSATDPARIDSSVISLIPGGELREPIERLGVPVRDLKLRRGSGDPIALWRLARMLRSENPDLVQTWMYHADLIGALVKPWLGHTPLCWNLRHSDFDWQASNAGIRRVVSLCAQLSRIAPRRIVCCSEQTRIVHSRLGYRSDIMNVIPNGFDLDRFRPDPDARSSLRQELGISRHAPLVGMAARFNPQKDANGFIAAASRVLEQLPDCRFIICGKDMDASNAVLTESLASQQVTNAFHLLGLRKDMARLMAAFDLTVSSSAFGEGFSNVIGESMACGTPVVATDVGDSRFIVGSTGAIVAPRDSAALADAVARLLSIGTFGLNQLGKAARVRIQRYYSLTTIAERYTGFYESVANKREAP